MSLDYLTPSDLVDFEKNILEVLSSDHWKKFVAEVEVSYRPVTLESHRIEGIRLGNFSKNDLIRFCLLACYDNSLFGFLIRVELEEKLLKTKGLEDLIFLLSVETVDNYLLHSVRFERRASRDILSKKNIQEFVDQLSIKFIRPNTRKPKRVQRHKGYRDHGTLPDDFTKAIRRSCGEDSTLRQIQIEKEQYQSDIELYLTQHRNYLTKLGESEFDTVNQNSKGVIAYVYKAKENFRREDSLQQRASFTLTRKERKSREVHLRLRKKDSQSGTCSDEH